MALASSGSRRALRSSLLLLAAVLVPVLLQPACGSSDGKKKANTRFNDGGEGGSEAASGGSSSPGAAAEGGGGATSGSGGTAPAGGEGAGPNDGGSGGSTGGVGQGEGGAAGGDDGPSCPMGTADCDADPNTCEADVTQLTQCGDCGVMCQQTNGTVICGDTGCEVTSCQATFGDCNDTGTDGCETPLNTAENCGICDHDCGGSACTNNLCAGSKLGSDAAEYRWTQTGDALYRITGYSPGYDLATSYVVTRTPLDGGAEVIMHSDSKSPGGLAVDAGYVYWAVNGTPPAVFRKAHSATAVTVPTPLFEPASIPVQISIQGGTMYFTNLAGSIFKRALSETFANGGDEIVTAAEVRGAGTFNLHQDFVTTPTAMYWVVLPNTGNQAFIRTAALAGGAANDVPGAITNSFLKLSVAGEDLYWIRATGAGTDGAYHYNASTGVEPLVIQSGLTAILADGDYLYLLGAANTLYRAPITGGASVKLGDSSGLANATDFAGSDANNVYTLSAFTHGAGFYVNGSVVAFPK